MASNTRNDAGDLIRAGYENLNRGAAMVRNRYEIDRELSSDDTRVYTHRVTGQPVVVHRGSKTARDWLIEDALIAVGKAQNTPRLRKAWQITWLTELKYKRPADAVGHSLGGRLAELSDAHGEIITFNKAAGLGDAFKTVGAGDRQTDLRTSRDAVSALSVTQRRRTSEIVPFTPKAAKSSAALRVLPLPARVIGGFVQGVADSHSAKLLD